MKKKVILLISAVLFIYTSQAQCPARENLQQGIDKIYFSKTLSPTEQLGPLSAYLDTIRNCSYKNDSTHAYLLRVIGSRYGAMEDYFTAVQYYRQSADIIILNAGKTSINRQHLLRCYYWLMEYYDLLNNPKEKMKAADSCIAIARQYNSLSTAEGLRVLDEKIEYYFDRGDYHRCIDEAKLCEKVAMDYIQAGENPDFGKRVISTSLGWHVKALLLLKDSEQAEKLISNKIDEYTKAGLKNYLGLIYVQLAEVQLLKGNHQNALRFYNQGLK